MIAQSNRACSLAQSAAPLPRVAGHPTRIEEEQCRRLADEAMVALRDAFAMGRDDAGSLDSDTDLEPLRGREDFRALRMDANFPGDPFAP